MGIGHIHKKELKTGLWGTPEVTDLGEENWFINVYGRVAFFRTERHDKHLWIIYTYDNSCVFCPSLWFYYLWSEIGKYPPSIQQLMICVTWPKIISKLHFRTPKEINLDLLPLYWFVNNSGTYWFYRIKFHICIYLFLKNFRKSLMTSRFYNVTVRHFW